MRINSMTQLQRIIAGLQEIERADPLAHVFTGDASQGEQIRVSGVLRGVDASLLTDLGWEDDALEWTYQAER